MKVVIVGTNHAGIAAANTLLDNYPEAEVTMIDRNTNLSYLGCGTALWVGRQIDTYENLFYTNKETFEAKGATIHMETSVTSVDFDGHVVHCCASDGSEFDAPYDKLILATGSLPISPKLPGHDLAGISFLKLFQEGQEVDRQVSDESVRSVAVVGAGDGQVFATDRKGDLRCPTATSSTCRTRPRSRPSSTATRATAARPSSSTRWSPRTQTTTGSGATSR